MMRIIKSQKSMVNNHNGFTLVEAVVAVGVIAVGFTGSLILLAQSSAQATNLRSRTVAAQLAAEGIEIVRNIRDTNWLAGRGWRDGLNDTATGLIDYNDAALSENADNASWCLNYVAGFYTHFASSPFDCNTFFKRHLEIRTLTDDFSPQQAPPVSPPVEYIEVKSIVEWQERDQTKNITIVDELYDWK
ncbi:MAG: prepilin-type N-terminal cleavage/methylation domain-containing protein [Parcubacteria group bacterium]|nr:prepilin-type N-terminal cleavage/methylation domain-containing protein [Parcubacteria group bacterium]